MNENKSLKINCGVCGVFGTEQAAHLIYLALYALQHRGAESAGIISTDGGNFYAHRGMGEVATVFSSPQIFDTLSGNAAIGHNRYSTTGASDPINMQPLFTKYWGGEIAIGHNGNITNYKTLRTKLESSGATFRTESDTELFLHLIARCRKKDLGERLATAFKHIKGAYSLVAMTRDSLIAARDPHGVRPLALGKLEDGFIVASETCAFDIMKAEYIRDVEPGEILIIDKNGPRTAARMATKRSASCIFEFVYFSRPDSKVFGENVDKLRRAMGRRLAWESPAEADFVISVPDSSNTAALGYSEASGIRLELGLIRNHYVGRTFILPDQKIRDIDALIKYNPVKGVISGKNIIVVDDSIVRGTTSRKIVSMLKEAGANKVHYRVSSPPLISPCFYGIDIPTFSELAAHKHDIEEIRRKIGADSLAYLSIDGMLSVSKRKPGEFCTACFSKKYPIPGDFEENVK
ncbi:MAG: amidophosphoribosyltransferase [candidate division Zixibacteria bacterium]|nr:amidophosphoribosyltransferase [candidate division Zixibacteria bacterium]